MTNAKNDILYIYIHDNPSGRTWKAQIDRAGFLDAATEIKLSGDAEKLKIAALLANRIEDLSLCEQGSERERELVEGDIEADIPGLFHLGALHSGSSETAFAQVLNGQPGGHYIVVRYLAERHVHLRTAHLPQETGFIRGPLSSETLQGALRGMEEADRDYLKSMDA